MRYGKPAIGDQAGRDEGRRRASASCSRRSIRNIARRRRRPPTTSAFAALAAACAGSRRSAPCRPIMTIRPISPRSKASVEASLAALDFEPEAIVASFHGMPQRTLELGDPYHCHCRKTARLLGEALGRELDRRVPVALRPGEMARAGDRHDARRRCRARASSAGRDRRAGLLRRLPGDAGGAERSAGGRRSSRLAGPDFAYLPCLNDSPAGIDDAAHIAATGA